MERDIYVYTYSYIYVNPTFKMGGREVHGHRVIMAGLEIEKLGSSSDSVPRGCAV